MAKGFFVFSIIQIHSKGSFEKAQFNVRPKKVVKISYTHNVLYKDRPFEIYLRIINDIGGQVNPT